MQTTATTKKHRRAGTKTCQYCFTPGLHWEQQLESGKWFLHDHNGNIHCCKEYRQLRKQYDMRY